MWAVAAQPRTGLTPMIPTPSVDSDMFFFSRQTTAHEMRLDLDLDVDLLAHQEPARLDRHVPGHPPVLAIDGRLRRRGEHRFYLHVWPPPEELPRESDLPPDVLDRVGAVEVRGPPS